MSVPEGEASCLTGPVFFNSLDGTRQVSLLGSPRDTRNLAVMERLPRSDGTSTYRLRLLAPQGGELQCLDEMQARLAVAEIRRGSFWSGLARNGKSTAPLGAIYVLRSECTGLGRTVAGRGPKRIHSCPPRSFARTALQ